MQNLFKNQFVKLKLLQKKQGVLLDFDKLQDENILLNELAEELHNEHIGFVLLGRCKEFSDRSFINLANKVKVLVKEFDATLIIESRADIASILKPDVFVFSDSDLEYTMLVDFLPKDIILVFSVDNILQVPNDIDFLIVDECNKDDFKDIKMPILLKHNCEEGNFQKITIL